MRLRNKGVNNPEYPKDSVSDLDPVGMTSSAPPLTKHGSEGYPEGEDGAITPQVATQTISSSQPHLK